MTFVQIEFLVTKNSLCLKIAEKVAFDIASEASYVYILSEQKFIKKSQKMINFYSCQTVLPVRPFLIDKNVWEKKSKVTFSVIFKHCVMVAKEKN